MRFRAIGDLNSHSAYTVLRDDGVCLGMVCLRGRGRGRWYAFDAEDQRAGIGVGYTTRREAAGALERK